MLNLIPKNIIKIIFFIIPVLIPFITNRAYWLHLLIIFGIYVILCAGLDLLYGFAGLTSLAHGTFFGIGAYTTGILQVRLSMPFWPALLISVLLTGILAAIIGIPMLRMKGHYFALGTIALATIVTLIIHNWANLTGGHGLIGIAGPGSFNFLFMNINFRSRQNYYFLVLIFIYLIIFLTRRIVDSKVGRAFIAIRENEDLAESLGINLLSYKLLSFVIASGTAAIAGSLYAGYMRSIEPSISGGLWGFSILVMVITGGPTYITGYIAGPFLVWLLPELLGMATEYRPLIFGVILILTVVFMPKGIMGYMYTKVPQKFYKRLTHHVHKD